MLAAKKENLSLWPQLFTERRKLNREVENEPYIEFLQTPWFNGQEYEEVEDEDEDEEQEEGDDGNEIEGEEDDENDAVEEEVSSGQGNSVEGHRSNVGNKDQNLIIDGNARSGDGPSKVRLFMTGFSGEEDDLHHRDQVEEVASICEQWTREKGVVTKTGKHAKHVALLDDRNSRGNFLTNKGISPSGDCRPYLGPLTSEHLAKELSRKRFRTVSEQNEATNAFDDEEADAERRVIFITDLDVSTIEALVMTASRTQAPALKDLFYKYLTRKTSIGVTIPPTFFPRFTLDFHIPYYVLKMVKAPIEDTRKKPDGNPLRQSWGLPFLSTSTSESKPTEGLYCLYEAQISVAVTGIDHWVWTAYCFVDTYFGSEDTVDGYDQLKGRRCRRWGRPDPLAAGQINAHEPIWTPREYFLKVFQVRVSQVLREWNLIGSKVEEEVKQSRTRADTLFQQSSNDPKARQQVRDFIQWNHRMISLLLQLIPGLSDTVEVWDQFVEKEIEYFSCQGDPPNALVSPIEAIDKVFREMKLLHKRLEKLRKEIREENLQGLNAHLSLENNDSTILQQRIAQNIQVYTILMVLFFPLSLTSNLFSATGVLPSTKATLPNFIKATFILAFLMFAIYLVLNVLFNWRWCLQLIIALLDYLRNAIISCVERPAEEKPCPDVSDTPKASKWGLPIWRSRKVDVVEPLDLESAPERQRQSGLGQS